MSCVHMYVSKKYWWILFGSHDSRPPAGKFSAGISNRPLTSSRLSDLMKITNCRSPQATFEGY